MATNLMILNFGSFSSTLGVYPKNWGNDLDFTSIFFKWVGEKPPTRFAGLLLFEFGVKSPWLYWHVLKDFDQDVIPGCTDRNLWVRWYTPLI